MKSIALAVLAALVTSAALSGCAIVPIGPPVYIGIHGGGNYGHGYYRY